jgi:putative zinc ribbon protein
VPKVAKLPVRVDAERWSRSSKQSYSYVSPPRIYEDIYYECWRCGAADVFTAAEQKTAFEVKQAYIWQRRILCQSCFAKRRRLEQISRSHSKRWRESKSEVAKDRAFLEEWLIALEELPRYAARRNTANIAMIKKRVAALA